jgi:hypothetical protein
MVAELVAAGLRGRDDAWLNNEIVKYRLNRLGCGVPRGRTVWQDFTSWIQKQVEFEHKRGGVT